jgi:hypothetical protein
MADQLYLSLWFPNFRLDALPSALSSVMRQFALISGDKRVAAASAYPLGFSESPTYQRIYVNDDRSEDTSASIIENAVAEATEQIHDDMAYEFEMRWKLWAPDSGPGSLAHAAKDDPDGPATGLDTLWKPEPATVRILGFGPQFDDAGYEQNGHIRVDFGLDYPWVLDDVDDPDTDPESDHLPKARNRGADEIEEAEEDETDEAPQAAAEQAATYIQKNVEMLLAFTLSVEKHCGISSRLLWTESGEPLAEKLIARLQRLH